MMYVSIDRKGTRFLHKHENLVAVANLDFLVGLPTYIEPIEPHTARICAEWSDTDMQKLYKRTTGQETCPYVGDTLRTILAELASLIPTTIATVPQTELQAAWLETRQPAGGGYLFAQGSLTPMPQGPRWEPAALVCTLTPEQGANAVRARITAAQRYAATLPPPVPVPPRNPAAAAVRTPRAASGAPRSGVCKAIWEALDAARAAANGDMPSRDKVKELAQANGWNPSTASVQFAAWKREKNLS